tara:strand:- start:304 stop:699 length:396 start_codon:yes stop_codon:yes gene_type:complete
MYDRELYHFLVLHFPIALFITGYFFDILCSLFNKNKFNSFVLWLMGFGLFWSFISILTGYITAFEMEYLDSLSNIFDKKHSNLMLINTVLFTCLFVFRNKNNNKILFFIHTICIALLMYGTHLGAKWADRI